MSPSPSAPTSSNKTADAAQSPKGERTKAAPRPSEEAGHGPGGSPRVPPEKNKPAPEKDESLDAESEDLYDNVACTD